ncbi:LOW QUALITY PROTEIN: homeobox protein LUMINIDEPENDENS-like [Durio zibethinus]|uniref:LOW QUALITY PROTEIN: homeobox protein LUMINIDEPENDENS-like n=1 Tax=Durio zibethinus TaxID=66656 RepID=A0A6P5ZZ86_DURZI|nr:LOW QUALITY PROTEIN: homeobox protein LUMINIDEPENDENS-like [Durio zibethinus]
MDVLKENLSELEIGGTVESLQKFIDFQRELFHSQIDQLQNVVVTQCKLTGVNPLAQEMAAGALSIKIGKRPRDLLNPKAVKYMQAVFSIKDVISKKESREISALFGVTVTQVRDFFSSQRTRVRKQVRLSREKAVRSNACKVAEEGVVPIGSDAMIPVEPVPLNSVGPANAEEAPSCLTQDDALTGIDELDKHFVENIFSKMRKEETFSGQVKLMEWILQIQNPSVLCWFLNQGGVMILATWLSQAAVEEQTTVLFIILKVLCHLPLQKTLPEHMSAILQSVNKLRLYRFSDISNRARLLISRWSKMFVRSQAVKKPNGLRTSTEAQNEMLLKQSISEIMGDDSWQANVDNSEGILATSNVRKLESSQVLKLLPASTDDSTKKNILGVSGSYSRERRKVQLVEQPGQKMAGKNSQITRTVPLSQSRPMSADDIQKAKMRALFMQSKHGKTGSSNGMVEAKSEGLNKPSTSQASFSPRVSKVPSRPAEEQKKPNTSPKTSNRLELLDPKQTMDSKESPWEKCQKIKIPWYTPPEIKLNDLWRVGAGESSKEVDVQKNRNSREKETFYYTNQEIPSNPKEPWDREMDYDDTLTPEIPTEQPPDTDCMETQVTHGEHVNSAVTLAPSSQIGGGVEAEPDLELLAVLLKNPALVFALTSGQSGNLTSADTVKLLDMIKAGNSNDTGKKVGEKVEMSLPSPTPSNNPGTSGWRPEVVRNPFSQQAQMGNRAAQPSLGVGTTTPVAERVPATSMAAPQQVANGPSLAQQLAAAMVQSLPQSNAMTPEKRQSTNFAFSHHGLPSNSPAIQPTASDIALTMKNQSLVNSLTNLSAAAGPSLRVGTRSNVKPASISMTPNVPEKMHSSFSMSPLMPTQSRPQMPPQLRPQQPHVSDPPLQTHLYSSRPPVGNISPMSDPWRARQSLASNPHSQANQNNYNASFGGPVQPQLLSGLLGEGNEYVGNEGFESWSPENSPKRSSEHVQGRNYLEPGMNSAWTYRPDRSWQGNSPEYRDQNRQGNRRWRDSR